MTKKKIKVAVGMSGGVDSSVAAKMLVDQGHEVIGFMMKFWADEACLKSRDNACCDPQSVEDAKRVARQIGIPFYVIDCREEFKKAVAEYFIEEYKNYRTPNPCIVCNEKIKFGWFLEMAKSVGCDYVATGHYARIVYDSVISNYQVTNPKKNTKTPNSKLPTHRLFKGVDAKKDQSYFLYRLNQKQLSSILLPLGEYTKDQVRQMAKKWNLPVGEKKESQEVCFIGDKDYREFLKRQLPAREYKQGNIVKNGDIIGFHQGLLNYTIGQRKGINQTQSNKSKVENRKLKLLPTPPSRLQTDKIPLYVLGVNPVKNELIVGEENDLYRDEMTVEKVSWIRSVNISEIEEVSVKIRYRAEVVPCTIINNKNSNRLSHPELISGSQGILNQVQNDKLIVRFNQPQRAITPGQSTVFYNGDEVLGGGIIG